MQLNRIRQSKSEVAPNAQSKTEAELGRSGDRSAWDKLQRAALTGFGVLGTVALLGLAACPADLANPSDYDRGPASNGGAPGAAGAGPGAGAGGAAPAQPGLNVDVTCMTAVFAKSCTIPSCHAPPVAANLDLDSPNVNTRLIDVVATHGSASPNTGCVANQKLIDSANPDQSWLILKLSTDGKTCGLPMPVGSPLSSDETACLKKYAQDVAAAAKAGGK